MSYYTRDNPYPPAVRYPRCPVCGEECEAIYLIGTDIIGCDMCYDPKEWPGEDVTENDPWEDIRCTGAYYAY